MSITGILNKAFKLNGLTVDYSAIETFEKFLKTYPEDQMSVIIKQTIDILLRQELSTCLITASALQTAIDISTKERHLVGYNIS
ncbi:hypothetical protein GJ496_006269 [Pomphorhynchus laevis]|nr:hypothetical protein GJ496_006269 [Pomphorhynchus laevis]